MSELTSFQAQGFESSSMHVHSSAIEDDDFSELDPETSVCSVKQIRLATQKPDRLLETSPCRRELHDGSSSSDTRSSIKSIVANMTVASPVSNMTRKISDIASSSFVSVKNIFSTVGLSELIEAISVFGKVSGASFATAADGLRLCEVKFEDVDSRRRAISAGKIAMGSHVFPVHPLDAVDVVTIRIKNINKESLDSNIHSRCKSLGDFVGLARTSKDVLDAFFNVHDDNINQKILKMLNSTVTDRKRWSADVVASKSKSSEVSRDEEDRYKLGSQILDHIPKLKNKLALKKVYLGDPETLTASINHIGLHPPTDLSGSP